MLASPGLGLGTEEGLGKSLLGRRALVRVWMHQHVGKTDGLLLQGMVFSKVRDCVTTLQSQGQKCQNVCCKVSKGVHRQAKMADSPDWSFACL